RIAHAESPHARAGGVLDLTRVAPDGPAVLLEHRDLVRERVDVAEGVPDVCVLGHDPQGASLSPAADEDGDAARRRRVQPAEPSADPRHRLLERRHARADRAEVVAVLAEVALVPAGAETQDEAPGSG